MDLDNLRALVTTIKHGSILIASEALGISRPTLRARITALEDELGVPLLLRSHRGVSPTEHGLRLAEGARTLLRDADALIAQTLRSDDGELGELSVVVPSGCLPPMMGVVLTSELRRAHPELKLEILSSPDPVRDASPSVDVVLHFSDNAPPGPYRTFSLTRFPVHALASRAYLAEYGTPQSVADLAQHSLLCWHGPGGDGEQWPLRDGSFVSVNPSIRSTEVLALRGLAAAGMGIALLPDAEVARGTIPGEDFEVVLPDQVGREGTLRVLLREHVANAARVRAIVRLLRELASGVFGNIPGDILLQPEDISEAQAS